MHSRCLHEEYEEEHAPLCKFRAFHLGTTKTSRAHDLDALGPAPRLHGTLNGPLHGILVRTSADDLATDVQGNDTGIDIRICDLLDTDVYRFVRELLDLILDYLDIRPF